jgi:hypothetical protein
MSIDKMPPVVPKTEEELEALRKRAAELEAKRNELIGESITRTLAINEADKAKAEALSQEQIQKIEAELETARAGIFAYTKKGQSGLITESQGPEKAFEDPAKLKAQASKEWQDYMKENSQSLRYDTGPVVLYGSGLNKLINSISNLFKSKKPEVNKNKNWSPIDEPEVQTLISELEQIEVKMQKASKKEEKDLTVDRANKIFAIGRKGKELIEKKFSQSI